jgi:hypothetical protein
MKMLETKVVNFKDDKTNFENELDFAKKSWKGLAKQVKEKDKTIHDLKKD